MKTKLFFVGFIFSCFALVGMEKPFSDISSDKAAMTITILNGTGDDYKVTSLANLDDWKVAPGKVKIINLDNQWDKISNGSQATLKIKTISPSPLEFEFKILKTSKRIELVLEGTTAGHLKPKKETISINDIPQHFNIDLSLAGLLLDKTTFDHNATTMKANPRASQAPNFKQRVKSWFHK